MSVEALSPVVVLLKHGLLIKPDIGDVPHPVNGRLMSRQFLVTGPAGTAVSIEWHTERGAFRIVSPDGAKETWVDQSSCVWWR